MTTPTPLLDQHKAAGATTIAFGDGEAAVEVVETFGELDFEYAALRKSCVMLDLPHRAVIEARGDDRLDFLNNMLTQELGPMGPGDAAQAFWLNRKGRVVSDLVVVEDPGVVSDGDSAGGPVTRLVLDVLGVGDTMSSLDSYIITEDVELRDARGDHRVLGLHGPTAPLLLGLASGQDEAIEIEAGHAIRFEIAGRSVLVVRIDEVGEIGLTLVCHAAEAEAVWNRLIEIGEPFAPGQPHDVHSLDAGTAPGRVRMRRAGWAAYNVARIEAGTPVFRVDYSTASLPAETGVLDERVSFTKGCYLGQEVVARMHALGHPKQRLVGLRLEGDRAINEEGHPRQAVGGAPVLTAAGEDGSQGNPVGQVTSSTISPMLGASAIAFAQVKWDHSKPGTRLVVDAEGVAVDAVVTESLRFLDRSPASSE